MHIRRSRRPRLIAALTTIVVAVSAAVTAASPATAAPQSPAAAPLAAAVDLALGRPATSDSTEAGRPASMANDGNPATRWCAANGATGHWWQVDLGSVSSLGSSQVMWEFARNYRYRITVSTDGTTWTTAVDQSAATSTAQTRADTFTARARYVRVTVTGLPAGTWASIVNFSVFSTPAPGAQPFKGLAGGSCELLGRLNVSWHYNWWINPGDCAAPGYVPTVSGRKDMTAGDVGWHVDRVYDAGHQTLLGFNEPNKADQSNMTMAQVLDLWPTLTKNRGDQNLRVSSPSTSSDGKEWFKEFLAEADTRGLQVDFLNVHWYGWEPGSCKSITTFEAYIYWAESLPGNLPIWITEWGCLNNTATSREAVEAFYTAAVAMFARHPRIERQSFYPWIKHHELTEPLQPGEPEGTVKPLTPLGRAFANTPAYR